MKHLFKSLVIAVSLLFTANAYAQEEFGGPMGGGAPQRQSVEEIAKTRGTSIAKSLKLKKADTKKFIATYTEYLKELQALRPQTPPKNRERRRQPNDSTAQRPPRQRGQRGGEPSEEMKKRMEEMQQKVQTIREKYAPAYAEYLSPEQIKKIYELEQNIEKQQRQQMRQQMQQMRQQMGGGFGGGRGGFGGDDF